MDAQSTTTARSIIEQLTPKAIAEACACGENAVYNCKEKFPAWWYTHIRDLCADAGIPCPEHLFAWKPVSDEKPRRGARKKTAGAA